MRTRHASLAGMGGVRRHKRVLGWIAIVALLSNVLTARVACAVDGRSPGRRPSGPARHLHGRRRQDGARQRRLGQARSVRPLPGLRDGQAIRIRRCPRCHSHRLPTAACGQAGASAVALARRPCEPRRRPQPRSASLRLSNRRLCASRYFGAQVRFSAETTHASDIRRLRGLGRAASWPHPPLPIIPPASARRAAPAPSPPSRRPRSRKATARLRSSSRWSRSTPSATPSSRHLPASTSTPTASTPYWRRRSSTPTA